MATNRTRAYSEATERAIDSADIQGPLAMALAIEALRGESEMSQQRCVMAAVGYMEQVRRRIHATGSQRLSYSQFVEQLDAWPESDQVTLKVVRALDEVGVSRGADFEEVGQELLDRLINSSDRPLDRTGGSYQSAMNALETVTPDDQRRFVNVALSDIYSHRNMPDAYLEVREQWSHDSHIGSVMYAVIRALAEAPDAATRGRFAVDLLNDLSLNRTTFNDIVAAPDKAMPHEETIGSQDFVSSGRNRAMPQEANFVSEPASPERETTQPELPAISGQLPEVIVAGIRSAALIGKFKSNTGFRAGRHEVRFGQRSDWDDFGIVEQGDEGFKMNGIAWNLASQLSQALTEREGRGGKVQPFILSVPLSPDSKNLSAIVLAVPDDFIDGANRPVHFAMAVFAMDRDAAGELTKQMNNGRVTFRELVDEIAVDLIRENDDRVSPGITPRGGSLDKKCGVATVSGPDMKQFLNNAIDSPGRGRDAPSPIRERAAFVDGAIRNANNALAQSRGIE